MFEIGSCRICFYVSAAGGNFEQDSVRHGAHTLVVLMSNLMFYRVFGKSLSPQKRWYVLTTSLWLQGQIVLREQGFHVFYWRDRGNCGGKTKTRLNHPNNLVLDTRKKRFTVPQHIAYVLGPWDKRTFRRMASFYLKSLKKELRGTGMF